MGTHKNERNKRILWFQDARFGMFIHWGLYSIPARGEWIQSVEKISTEEYEKYAQHFKHCLLYTSPSPRDRTRSRMPSSA